MDVFDNVKIPLSLIGVRGKEAENRVNKVLEQVGMLDYAHKNVTQLSVDKSNVLHRKSACQ
jgi:ABC-type methionine transport system ATPase subunit